MCERVNDDIQHVLMTKLNVQSEIENFEQQGNSFGFLRSPTARGINVFYTQTHTLHYTVYIYVGSVVNQNSSTNLSLGKLCFFFVLFLY